MAALRKFDRQPNKSGELDGVSSVAGLDPRHSMEGPLDESRGTAPQFGAIFLVREDS